MAVMKDVAKLAEVSISTVSFVLNGTAKKHKVADKTALKVLKAAKQLGYKVNAPDNGELLQLPSTIAFFAPMDSARLDMNIVYESVSKHIKQAAAPYNVLICPYEKGQLLNKIRQVDLSDYGSAVVAVENARDMEALEHLDAYLPFVLFNAASRRFSSVSSHIDESIAQIVGMITAKGYRKIVILSGSDTRESGNEYLEAMLRLLEENGISIPDSALIANDNMTLGGALAARRILTMEQKPEMIVCLNSALAYGAIPLLARNGFLIPRDAELVCFGSPADADLAANYFPTLSMVSVPLDEITRRAFEIAVHLLGGGVTEPLHLECPCKLVLNNSFSV